MKIRDVITIVLGLVVIVKLDFILNLSYWQAFELGTKIVILTLPLLILFAIILLGIFIYKRVVKSRRARKKPTPRPNKNIGASRKKRK